MHTNRHLNFSSWYLHTTSTSIIRAQSVTEFHFFPFFLSFCRDLRYNHIREIPSEAFSGLKHLHTIFLNENQVITIHSGAFQGLPSLKYLYLNKNRITIIAEDAFNQLDRLQSL